MIIRSLASYLENTLLAFGNVVNNSSSLFFFLIAIARILLMAQPLSGWDLMAVVTLVQNPGR